MTATPATTTQAEPVERSVALQALLDALTAERFGRLPSHSTDDDHEDAP